MSAYVIFTRIKTVDQDEMDKYAEAAPAGFEGFPIKFLASKTKIEVIEGPEIEAVVLVEFPSFEEAKTWYYSDAYATAREYRLKGAEYRAVIVESL